MRISRSVLVVVAALTALSACGAILGFEPLDISGDGDGGAGKDDASTPKDGTATGDAPPADGPVIPPDAFDASADASDAWTVCADHHDFCDDFEGVRTLQGQWNGTGIAGSGSLLIEAGTLRAEIPPGDAGGGYATLNRQVVSWVPADAGVRPRIHIQFRARVDLCPADKPIVLSSVALNGFELDVWIFADTTTSCAAALNEVSSAQVYRGSGALPVSVGAWQDYDLDVTQTPAGAPGQANLTLAPAGGSVSFTLSIAAPPPDLFHVFGVAQGTLAGVLVYLDDFRIDYLK